MHYPQGFKAMTCYFPKDHCILRRKVHYQEGFQAMTFFLKVTAFSGRKVHYQGMTSSDHLFFKDHLEFGKKLVLNIPNFMPRFWHANCMTSLRSHRTPLVWEQVI